MSSIDRLSRLFLVSALVLKAGLAQAAGFAFLEVPADADGPTLRGSVWSPCLGAAQPIALGPLVVNGSKDCPVAGTQLPLVVISHGSGGSFLGHHHTAAALADAGFQLWASAHGGDGVTAASVAALRAALPTPPDWRVAANAGHFAFLAPCPEALTRMEPAICRDGPGFDRVAFHRDFNAAVVAFFDQHLAKPPRR